MLHVAPSTFEVIQLQSERDGPAYAALRVELTRLDALVELLLNRRSDPDAMYGQRYQLELIERGTFDIPSLNTDSVSHAVASLVVADKSVFYAFDNDRDMILGASSLADGFPLMAIVIPSKRVMINLGDPVWGMGPDHLRALSTLSVQYPIDAAPDPDPRRVTVVTGDPNFAHHVWNQLTAFEALTLRSARDGPLDIIATHQPLGPLRELFPEAADWSVSYCPDSYLEGRNGTGRMFVPLAGLRISRHVQERLQRFTRSRLTAEAGSLTERLAGTRRPVFWFSIRTRNRTATNQIEALVALGRAVLGAYPTACIILDGHSLPADFGTNPSYDSPGTLAIVDDDRAVAEDVIIRLRAGGNIGAGHDVVAMVGWNILDSIAVASLADLYFCHHGTVQHKIGWLTDVPGIVHCNRRTLELRPASWVASKVENGVEPVYINESFIDDEAPPTELSEVDDSLRIECYRFIDIERFCEAFLDMARNVITEPLRPVSELHVNGERISMRPADMFDVSAATSFEHADRMTLQRELLRIRNGLLQAQRAKELVTAELVELVGRLRAAEHVAHTASAEATVVRDELTRRDAELKSLRLVMAEHDAQMQGQQAELARRNLVTRRLNDELVRRDIEVLELRAELRESLRQSVELGAEFDSRSFATEQLLAIGNVQRAAIAGLRGELDSRSFKTEQLLALVNVLRTAAAQARAHNAPAFALPKFRIRRVAQRVRGLVGRLRAAVAQRIGAR